MQRTKVSPDVVTFSSAIDACAKGGGQWEQALKLLDDMQAAKLSPDVVTFDSALDACVRAMAAASGGRDVRPSSTLRLSLSPA